ncbi:MAG TPA: hypothetical protein VMM76_10910 [Pirellulaceae bacterium]|nr:hypothetical protein [Pirellulaceae bacterium]
MSVLLLMCVFVIADDPPRKQGDAPPAKKSDEPKKKAKKAKAPAGYEDAPEAGDPPAPRNAVVVEALEAPVVEGMAAEFEQLLALKVDANVANLEQQFLPQFIPLKTAELSFINRVCNLNLEQRKKLHAASDRCVKVAVRKWAMTQNGMRRVNLARGQQTLSDPTDLLHLAFANVLQETLQPEQQAAYDAEMKKREAHRKRVAIENVVAIIDERLALEFDQRQKLAESLDKHWQPNWVQSIEMLINNNHHLPSIPDQFVTPALNETQRQVWRTAQKQNYMVFGGFAWGQQPGPVDDFPLVENEVDLEKPSAN